VPFAAISAADYDAVLISTDHDAVDYAALSALGVPIVDTRNAIARRGLPGANVTKA
jgi:UDP-N-acetyl-D-glucosamine dehydrogenase